MSNRIEAAQAIARSMADPVKRSGRKVGAEEAIPASKSERAAPLSRTSGPRVGDGKATCRAPEQASHSSPAVQISGAPASGEEATATLKTTADTPPRKSARRKSGADQAKTPMQPSRLSPDPQNSGSNAGVSDANSPVKPIDGSHPDDTFDHVMSGLGEALAHAKGEPTPGLVIHTPVDPLVEQIVWLGRARRDWMKTRVSIELRGSAICRRFANGDKDEGAKLWKSVKEGTAPDNLIFAAGPLLAPIANLKEHETGVDRSMTKHAAKHFMAGWAKSIRGFGHAGLAKVIAECGDLGSYRNPSCVWKRMGLAVINGGRQRRVPGAEALEHGYNAERRSVMWNVGGAVIGGMGKGPRPLVGEDVDARTDLTEYQKLFVRRLRLEAERDPEAHAREPVTNKETGVTKESFSAHAANRAKRYVEKRLLRDLWITWRRAGQETREPQSSHVGSPIESEA